MQRTGDLCQAFHPGTHLTASCLKEGDVISLSLSLSALPLLSLAHSLTGGGEEGGGGEMDKYSFLVVFNIKKSIPLQM